MTRSLASSALGVATNQGGTGPVHQKCWLLSDLTLGKSQEAQVNHPSLVGPTTIYRSEQDTSKYLLNMFGAPRPHSVF